MNLRKGPDYIAEDRGYITPCWIWQGAANNRGYGVTTKGSPGKARLAHVVFYEKAVGLVPCGLELDHLCSVPLCVNPSHQEAVSHTENVRRGRKSKLSMGIARTILEEYNAPGNKYGRQSMLARRFGVRSATVHVLVHGKTWKESMV